MNIVEIVDFTKTYKKKMIAVNNLTLRVKQGSFFGFVGPNGAGKTTTVHFIASLLKQSRGELLLFGDKITDDSFEHKRRMGFVLEKPLYIEKLTGQEYLHFVGQMYDLDKNTTEIRTTELLDILELTEKKNVYIETYSAGMKKKISLAAAMIHDPDLLILDEPFEGVDPVSSRIIRENLKLMVKKGKTIFLTSHILEVVEKLCDEIAIINKGRLIFQDSTKSIREKFKNKTGGETYAGLEDLFHHLVMSGKEKEKLSWLE